jgi:hypothetical protein
VTPRDLRVAMQACAVSQRWRHPLQRSWDPWNTPQARMAASHAVPSESERAHRRQPHPRPRPRPRPRLHPQPHPYPRPRQHPRHQPLLVHPRHCCPQLAPWLPAPAQAHAHSPFARHGLSQQPEELSMEMGLWGAGCGGRADGFSGAIRG